MGQILLGILILCCRIMLAARATSTIPPTPVVALSTSAIACLPSESSNNESGAWAFVPTPVATAADLGIPYDRYQVRDEFGRTITFYVSVPGAGRPKDAPKDDSANSKSLPLALMVQGSGCNSVFMKAPDGRIGGGLPNAVLRAAKGRCRVLCIEKPGVKFLDNPQPPGAGEPCSDEFKTEHAYKRWVGACTAAVNAAAELPGIDANRILAAGHSEGGIVAAGVAARDARVTHVAVLSGGGPSQLFDMGQVVRELGSENETAEQREARVEEVYRAWERIKADPESTTKSEWGHPYKRWSSFLAVSPLEELEKSTARVFIAYGTADTSVPVVSNDVLRAELVRKGKDVTCERVVGGDHGYRVESKPDFDGLSFVFDAMVNWFLTNPQGPNE